MPVYVETAEGLVKPLVTLPATIMLLPPFILIFPRHHHPFVLADSFVPTTHFIPILPYKSIPRSLSPLFLDCFLPPYYVGEYFLIMAEQCS